MRRRELLLTTAASAPILAQRSRQPNIVFILADDLGYGDIGCYGQAKIQTPVLDRLAAEGMRFTQAYAGSTVCAPSRCCLMTGKHTGHASVRGNVQPELGLQRDEATVASVLKTAGYRTALFGKWGLGGHDRNSHPNDKGFDEFFGYLNQVHAHQAFPDYLWEDKSEYFLKDNWFFQRKVFSNDLFTNRALDFVNRQQPARAPFFLYLSYTVPHANNELGRMQKNGMEAPDFGRYEAEAWPDQEKNFASAVSRMDEQIGRLLQAIDDRGLADHTLVIFSSDNGPHREGGHDPEFFRSSGPLRGTKRDLYEGAIRVPTIARWKGRIRPGQTSDAAWAFWDFLPTAAELAGVRKPAGIDGVSIAPILFGTSNKNSQERFYWEFFEGGFQQAVREGDWKLVRQAPTFNDELFHLGDDPGERNNVAAANPQVVARLRGYLQAARTDHPRFPTRKS
jgi:arylsulfatase A-like enzyme